MNELNEDIFLKIFTHLDYVSLTKLSQTCKKFYNLIYDKKKDDLIWKHQYENNIWWCNDPEEPLLEEKDFKSPPESIKYLDRIRERIDHISRIFAYRPFFTINFLYNEKTCSYGVSVFKTRYNFMKEFSSRYCINYPFKLIIYLPDGKEKVFKSVELRRYTKPIYYDIGIEYCMQPKQVCYLGKIIKISDK